MTNPRKRAIEEVGSTEAEISRNTKRKTDESTNSDTSTSYVSAAAAIFSESESDSKGTAQTDPESESELSTSSEEPSSESDSSSEDGSENEGERITNVRPGVKPVIKVDDVVGGGLLDRLKTFLPALEKANGELEKAREDGTLKDKVLDDAEDGEEEYIEMDLGLGVLEEKRPGVINESDDEMSSDNETESLGEEKNEKDILGSLLGQRHKRKAISIEEVQDG
ncbi:hypothetical protein EJ08DRAFT_21259 [Tothia fuscella]|uniref:Uncharacterized protein n=1 Tax=Tothia fuscella TaxID=1048955 RepID=A0A9P4NX63_9PEZI|nr:hypothetical protein EJ08DRAFT_21259 [Tothia fuscella]